MSHADQKGAGCVERSSLEPRSCSLSVCDAYEFEVILLISAQLEEVIEVVIRSAREGRHLCNRDSTVAERTDGGRQRSAQSDSLRPVCTAQRMRQCMQRTSTCVHALLRRTFVEQRLHLLRRLRVLLIQIGQRVEEQSRLRRRISSASGGRGSCIVIAICSSVHGSGVHIGRHGGCRGKGGEGRLEAAAGGVEERRRQRCEQCTVQIDTCGCQRQSVRIVSMMW